MTTTHPFIVAVRHALATQSNPERAVKMAAYLKTDQPFYGVQAKERTAIFKACRSLHPITTVAAYEAIIFELWESTHREEMHLALDVAEMKPFYQLESWSIYERLARSADWWDTLDRIAGTLVSKLYTKHPDFVEPRLIAWRTDERMWVRRASLLAHLKQKAKVNKTLLGETILLLAHEKEFFIRKAIGWALRDYSYANPVWVEQFIQDHGAILSNLSKREGMKVIERKRIAKDRKESSA